MSEDRNSLCRIISENNSGCPSLAGALSGYEKIYVVADESACRKSVFVRGLVDSLAEYPLLEIMATEGTKVMDTVLRICGWLLDMGADRDALVLAVGGGITTDMAGFAASIYKRGVRFAHVPTTLLAQVDAAIGGKTGVNYDRYKNILGVIRQPEFTYINPRSLASLSRRDFLSGAAELLKTFIISDNGFYEASCSFLSGEWDDFETLGNLVKMAASVKADVVSSDQFESGVRRKLNLGHTFAHAIETLAARFPSRAACGITHGEAVSMGIVLAARLAESLPSFNAEKGLADRLKADFEACGLPVDCPFSVDEMATIMSKDKKAERGIIHFVLPCRIGQVEVVDIAVDDAVRLL